MPDIVLESETSLHEAMEALSDFIGITVPVVDNRHHMKLLGIIFENSVISAYNEAVEQARNEERGLA
jgi:CBS domain-containing protein